MADTILILGNGFDLSMGRKTSYSDFVEFANNLFLEKEANLQSFLNSNNIDIEKIHNEIYEKPENATYNEQTKELKLDKDGLDFAISIDEAKNMLKEKKEEYIIPLRKVKAEITYDKLGKDIFPDLLRNISNKL